MFSCLVERKEVAFKNIIKSKWAHRLRNVDVRVDAQVSGMARLRKRMWFAWVFINKNIINWNILHFKHLKNIDALRFLARFVM